MLKHLARPICLALSTLLLTTGCGDDPLPTAAPAEFNPIEPWSGSFSGLSVASADAFPCPAGTTASSRLTGTATLGYLGLATITVRNCNRVLGATASQARVQVEGLLATIAFSAGDTLFAEGNGYQVGDRNCTALSEFNNNFTMTRGTGRFARYTGTATAIGTQVSSACPATNSPPPLTTVATISGVLFNK